MSAAARSQSGLWSGADRSGVAGYVAGGAAALILGVIIAMGRGSSAAVVIAAGLALAPLFVYVALYYPAVGAGLFMALQLAEPAQVQSPVGTISPGIVLLALLFMMQAPALAAAYQESKAVRTGVLLLLLWLATFVTRLSAVPLGTVIREFITSSSFVVVSLVGIAVARRAHAIRNIAIGAAFALIVLALCGVLASMHIIPHPSRQWHPEFAGRSLIPGVGSPVTRNYGLNVTFDSVSTMLPLCVPYLLLRFWKGERRGRWLTGVSLGVIALGIIFVFQSRDMLIQFLLAVITLLFLFRPRIALALVVISIPYSVYAINHLAQVDQVSSSLRKADLSYVISHVTSKPQDYFLGTDEVQVARDAAASVDLAGVLETQHDTNIHSFFLENLVAGGWFAFLAVIAIYAYALLSTIRVYRAQPQSFLAQVMLIGAPSLFFTISLEPVIAQVVGMWLFAGLAIGRARVAGAQPRHGLPARARRSRDGAAGHFNLSPPIRRRASAPLLHTNGAPRKRLLLFDWAEGGHHSLYIEKIIAALPPSVTIIVAAPATTVEQLADPAVQRISLGGARPRGEGQSLLARTMQTAAREEFGLFRRAIQDSTPDYAIHLFADGLLPLLTFGPNLETRVIPLLFRPRAHYPAMYRTRLSSRQRFVGEGYEAILKRWRRRRDAHVVFTLDDGAAARWAATGGAPAAWFPEPPVSATVNRHLPRSGVVLYGSLGPRKGIDRLARAIALPGSPPQVTLAGGVIPSFAPLLASHVENMRAANASVILKDRWFDETQTLALLAASRCVVIPYVGHLGMSRVLLEAASAGTPVVAHNDGLIGHLVREHRLGLAIDASDPGALRQATDLLLRDDAAWAAFQRATVPFADRYSPSAFAAVLRTVIELPEQS